MAAVLSTVLDFGCIFGPSGPQFKKNAVYKVLPLAGHLSPLKNDADGFCVVLTRASDSLRIGICFGLPAFEMLTDAVQRDDDFQTGDHHVMGP